MLIPSIENYAFRYEILSKMKTKMSSKVDVYISREARCILDPTILFKIPIRFIAEF